MCMFSRPVRHVASTHIFAALLPGGRQSLAYAMDFEAREALAMVLPVPTPSGAAEDALSFVDLSAHAELFDDLARAFPPLPFTPQSLGRSAAADPAARPRLKVHEVGAFEASFVPTRGDFDRLDERFRLPAGVMRTLTEYDDWGFVVVKLRPRSSLLGLRSRAQRIHPVAFVFETRSPRDLYFPTVHVHDGSRPERAAFDHQLYAQPDPVVATLLPWTAASTPIEATIGERPGRALLNDGPAFRSTVLGELPNQDVWLRANPRLRPEQLHARGEAWSLRLCATRAFDLEPSDERFACWKQTAVDRLNELADRLPGQLATLFERNAERWQLAPLSDAMAPHFINGRELWRGTSWLDGSRDLVPGPARVHFAPFTDRVEPQSVSVGFAEPPDAATTEAILRALEHTLDDVISRHGQH